MNNKLSRRQFLKGTALGAAGLAAAGILGPNAAVAEDASGIQWDYEADVVVIGAGGAGLPAALKAMEDGASVLLVEANWDVGGHCAVSGGNLHSGGGTVTQKKYGIVDSADQYYIDHTSGVTLSTRFDDRNYVRSVADSMAECYDFCVSKGLIVQDKEPSRRNYVLDGFTEPESVARWTYTDASTEGWEDIYTGRGNAGLGITRPLERTLRQQGARFLLNYHMDKIYREETFSGRVLGVKATYTPTILPDETEPLTSLFTDGNIETTQETVNIKANRGVIIATGGSIGNERFRTMFDPRLGPEFDGLSGMPFSDQDGSGELAAMEIGASLGNLASFMQHGGHQITMANRFGCRYGYGSGYNEKSKLWKLVRANGITPDYDSLCIVNMIGQRCGNEDKGAGGKYSYDSYEFFNTALASVVIDENGDGNAQRYGGPLWAIFDQDAVERNDWKMEQGIVDFEGGYCFKADTLEELANAVVNKYYEHVKMDPALLVETIRRYNAFVEEGVDHDWGKKTLGYKIERGPFYAAWATPNLHDCYAGLRVDASMQVLDLHGELIPGLFCCGESSGGMRIHGLGRVMTSGYIAGRSAASADAAGLSTASNALSPDYAGPDISLRSPLEFGLDPKAPSVKPGESPAAYVAAAAAVEEEETEETPAEEAATAPVDGDLFIGSSDNGIGGTVQVQIAVKDGKMTAIEVIKQNETEGIGTPVFEPLIEQALETQSCELDAFSGATVTSNAFMEALGNAMAKAGL